MNPLLVREQRRIKTQSWLVVVQWMKLVLGNREHRLTGSCLVNVEEKSAESNEAGDWDEIYRRLRTIAGRFMREQRRDHTLSPTALANEAYVKISGWKNAPGVDREHLVAVAATAMRQILVNHARRRSRLKRGGDAQRIPLGDHLFAATTGESDLLEIDDALNELMKLDPRKGRIVELRFFGGLTVDQVAALLDLSRSTIESEWRSARAWLLTAISGGDERDSNRS
jgi:RNA polymerase sigma-70 factor (ECF subfamily)